MSHGWQTMTEQRNGMNVFTKSLDRLRQLCKCEAFGSGTTHCVDGGSVGNGWSTTIATSWASALDHFFSGCSEWRMAPITATSTDLCHLLLAHREHKLNGPIDKQANEAEDNANGLAEHQRKEWRSKSQAHMSDDSLSKTLTWNRALLSARRDASRRISLPVAWMKRTDSRWGLRTWSSRIPES